MSKDENAGETRRPTVITLSNMAGVAPSTVTRALRGDTRISVKTRERILSLAEQHGYTPNFIARTLASGRTGLYGLVLGSQENPFYPQLLYEATRQAEALGFRILIIHAGPGPIEGSTAQALLNYKVNGCLISSASLSSQVCRICEDNGVPLVMVNRVAEQQGNAVICDNRAGGAELANHLITRGRRSFGIVSTSNFSSTGRDREEGFTDALTHAGFDVMLRLNGESTYDGGFAAGGAIAQLPRADRPQAVFALSDIMAMGVMDALRLARLNVPGDIAVVGFDGISDAARPIYDLTSFEPPLTLMLARAFEMVEARVRTPNLPQEVVTIRGRLMVRSTSG